MSHMRIFGRSLIALVLIALLATPAGAASTPYRTAFFRWRAADAGFAGWSLAGAIRAAGALQLDPQSAVAGTDVAGGYNGRNFYNGGGYLVGEATSPELTTSFGFYQ